MAIHKKHFSNFQIKNLLKELNTRDITDEEIDLLREMFYEKYGVAMKGMCLHPYWLLNEIEIEAYLDEESQEEILAWKQQGIIDEFDDRAVEIPDVDISFICSDPDKCYSFQKNGIACQCIRDNFSSPQVFQAWRDKQLKKLGDKIIEIIPL